MTERLRTADGSGDYSQNYNTNSATKMASDDLSPRKTLLVLVVVIGCFAVLWPKLFYPMLIANANQHIKPSSIDKTTGCCDVISEIDVNTIKIMSELCSTIIPTEEDKVLTAKEIVTQCRRTVLETCGIDISAVLQKRVSLGQSVKQILEEVRSLNGSLCLKYNFGVSPWRLGVPHRITVKLDPSESIRQERSSHLRSEMVHPAFRERGRAIPQPETIKRSSPPPRIVDGRPGPIPGLRPSMGGAGHVVPSKQQNTGVMGLLMPIYTIGIVIFFTYTVMKLAFKKKTEAYVGASLYPPVEPDENFRKEVFQSERGQMGSRVNRDSMNSKLVVNAMSALLDEVDQEIQARRKCSEVINEQDEVYANGSAVNAQDDDQASVKVLGMEMTASCEGGKKWSRPDSPVVPAVPPPPTEPVPPPQEIFLEGTLPPQSQLLVAESATETQKSSEEDPAVVLAGKMTLSVISLDSSENGTDESSNSDKKRDSIEEERRTSSSHGSEEFEKIDAEQLEDQINDIIEEAQNLTGVGSVDDDFNLLEEIEKINQEIKEDIERENIADESKDKMVIEEIKKQLKLEDELLEALVCDDTEVKELSSDTIKNFIEQEIIAIEEEAIPHVDNLEKINIKSEEQVELSPDHNRTNVYKEDLDNGINGDENKTSHEENKLAESGKKMLSASEILMQALETPIHPRESEMLIGVLEMSTQQKDKQEDDKDVVQTSETSVQQMELAKETENIIHTSEIPGKENESSTITQAELPIRQEIENKEENIQTSDHLKNDEPIDSSLKVDTDTTVEKGEENLKTEIPEEILRLDKAAEQNTASDHELRSDAQSKTNQDSTIKQTVSSEESKSKDVRNVTLEESDKSVEQIVTEKSEDIDRKIDEPQNVTNEEFHIEDPEEDYEDEAIVDIEYEDSGDEALNDEIRNVEGMSWEERVSVERMNGDDLDQSKYGTTSSATAAENEISDEEIGEEEDEDEEIEEIIEYVDNTDEEGEEIIEVAVNDINHVNENSHHQ